jgi:trehalose 6-phosphate synthase/phosphatase
MEVVRHRGRSTRLGVFPLGIDVAAFDALARQPAVTREALRLRAANPGRLMVAVDRLDYTKGIPRRLLAFETLLARHPELIGRVQLLQVAAPTRTDVHAYRRFRRQVDRLVGRINGRFGTPSWTPVLYLYRGVSQEKLAGLYRAADVMLVTPVRDGLNLVAKEFVACRTDEDGVLVLSEFAGASAELAEAVHVHPYDIEGTADQYHRALLMSRPERRVRMRALRGRVLSRDVGAWGEAFQACLAEAHQANDGALRASPPREIELVVTRLRSAAHLELLLDYDGTLVPFAGTPELAAPDAELLELLRDLGRRPGVRVHLVSGRPRETLERWFGSLPIHLHAEHGYWSRQPGARWSKLPITAGGWRDRAHRLLREFAERTPGSLVESKAVGLAWHYRMTDPEFGARQANELRVHLAELFSNAPVEVLTGERVIELRPHGVNKGVVARRVAMAASADALLMAMGDDATDEDLFEGLPPEAVTVHIGPRASRALLRLEGVEEARDLLAALVRRSEPAASASGFPTPD